MRALLELTKVEARLFLRDPANLLFAVLLPTVLLAVLGSIPALAQPDEQFGGLRFIDVWIPSLLVITLATLGVQVLPGSLATYRERGILRRLSTTPVPPALLLLAQLLVNLVAGAVAVALLLAVAALAFDVPLPADGLGFAAAWLLGASALFSLGLVLAALAPGNRAAVAAGTLVLLLVMFFGGVYLPRFLLPEAIVRIGDWVPPGVQALQDAWTGAGPDPVHLLGMAGLTALFGVVAARLFRWE